MGFSSIGAATATDMATLLSRLSGTRAGYLDNLSGGAVALASAVDALEGDTTTLLSRLSGTRAGYLDNLSGGAVALASAIAALPTTPINRIQAFSITVNNATSGTATITSVDTAKSIIIPHGATDGDGSNAFRYSWLRWAYVLTNATTVTVSNSDTRAYNVILKGMVVEFK